MRDPEFFRQRKPDLGAVRLFPRAEPGAAIAEVCHVICVARVKAWKGGDFPRHLPVFS